MTRPRLLYFFDALCGWCFGFGPTMARVAEQVAPRLEVEVISGGLRPAPEPLAHAAAYIRSAYPRVEQATGVRFGRAFIDGPLTHGDLILESRSPAMALALVRQGAPEHALAFSRQVQEALYVHGQGLSEAATYAPLVRALGLDVAAFTRAFHDPASQALAEEDFARARALGVSSYPTLVLEHDGERTLIAQGALPLDAVLARLQG